MVEMTSPNERVATAWLTKVGAADTDVLKWLMARAKKGKGVVQIPMVERAFALLPGWSIVNTTAYLPLVGLDSSDVLQTQLAGWRSRWKVGRVEGASTVKKQNEFHKIEDVAGARRDFLRHVEVVHGKEPTGKATVGALYATPPIEGPPSSSWVGSLPGFNVRRMWLGVPGWVLTANGKSVTLPSPITRKGHPLDPNRLDPWASFWTWAYKAGLESAAKEALAKHEETVTELAMPAAERKRVQQARILLPEILKLLTGVVNKQFQNVWDSWTDQFVDALAFYLKVHDAAWEKESAAKAYPSWDDWQFYKHNPMMTFFQPFLRDATEVDTSDSKREVGGWRVRRNNYLDLARARAKIVAERLRDEFVHKNGTKLSHIARAKGNLENGRTTEIFHGEDFGGEMVFVFKDGSQFTVRNKTVFKISPLGKGFEQFPTTFHDVVMPDGSRMGAPSEQRMLDVFVRPAV
jgi:hypothetical protein